ncbi:hypothetical protein ACFLT6_00250 [Chloroflexota bacterium]
MDGVEATKQISPEMELAATRRAIQRAKEARWDLNVAIFLFTVLIIIIILLFQDIVVEIVAPIAVFGLAMAWLIGWRNGRQLYNHFYEEELELELREVVIKATVEESVEAMVQKALRDRLS